MFRFSGLPNNAQLEMVETTKRRTEADVTVMLQLEDGSRQSGQFQPATTVLDIVQKLGGSRSDAADIVIIYMRTEIYGDAIGTTTLKSLGLTGGRAMMRMIHRQPEQLKMYGICEKVSYILFKLQYLNSVKQMYLPRYRLVL